MPQGDKSRYTDKQKRKARHIEQGYEARGLPKKEAQARAWATVRRTSSSCVSSVTSKARTGTPVASAASPARTKSWIAKRL